MQKKHTCKLFSIAATDAVAVIDDKEGYVNSIRNSLEKYKKRIHCFQTQGSKNAYRAISSMLLQVESLEKTVNDLRAVVKEHTSKMGRDLRDDFGFQRVSSPAE